MDRGLFFLGITVFVPFALMVFWILRLNTKRSLTFVRVIGVHSFLQKSRTSANEQDQTRRRFS